MFARIFFALVHFGARKGLSVPSESNDVSAKFAHRRLTGIRGETYAYWYLRRHGYVMVARNYRAPGDHAEIDLIGYDGATLAFIEVKTRTMRNENSFRPEIGITAGKYRAMSRMAQRFLRERRLKNAHYRFDVLALENWPGRHPTVRLHKGAFSGD